MKITRIDPQTVNCIITEEDLDEQGVRLEDFIEKKENAVEFLQEILSRAANEVGYAPKGNITSMQAMLLNDGSISLTLSENPAANLRQMLENITKRLGVKLPDRILQEIGDAPEEERIDRLKDFVANFKDFTEMFKQMMDKAGEEAPAATQTKRLLFHEYVFAFDSMRQLIRFAGRIPQSVKVESMVLKDEAEDCYYLILNIGEEQEMVFASMFTIGYEYGRYVTTNAKQILYMKEHMTTVIAEDAIQKLRQVGL